MDENSPFLKKARDYWREEGYTRGATRSIALLIEEMVAAKNRMWELGHECDRLQEELDKLKSK